MDSHEWKLSAKEAKLTLKTKTEASLFSQGLHALYDFMDPVRGRGVAPIVNLDLKGTSLAHVLDQVLASTLTWSYQNKAHYHTIIIHQLLPNHIIAVLEGDIVDSFHRQLKQPHAHATHSDHKDGWFHASLTFDL